MKSLIEEQGIDLSELKNDEYSTDLTLFMYNEYGKIEIGFQEIEFNQTVPKLTSLLEKNCFFDDIDNPEAATDFFVENHNLISDEYVNIKLDYLQNKTFRTNLF